MVAASAAVGALGGTDLTVTGNSAEVVDLTAGGSLTASGVVLATFHSTSNVEAEGKVSVQPAVILEATDSSSATELRLLRQNPVTASAGIGMFPPVGDYPASAAFSAEAAQLAVSASGVRVSTPLLATGGALDIQTDTGALVLRASAVTVPADTLSFPTGTALAGETVTLDAAGDILFSSAANLILASGSSLTLPAALIGSSLVGAPATAQTAQLVLDAGGDAYLNAPAGAVTFAAGASFLDLAGLEVPLGSSQAPYLRPVAGPSETLTLQAGTGSLSALTLPTLSSAGDLRVTAAGDIHASSGSLFFACEGLVFPGFTLGTSPPAFLSDEVAFAAGSDLQLLAPAGTITLEATTIGIAATTISAEVTNSVTIDAPQTTAVVGETTALTLGEHAAIVTAGTLEISSSTEGGAVTVSAAAGISLPALTLNANPSSALAGQVVPSNIDLSVPLFSAEAAGASLVLDPSQVTGGVSVARLSTGAGRVGFAASDASLALASDGSVAASAGSSSVAVLGLTATSALVSAPVVRIGLNDLPDTPAAGASAADAVNLLAPLGSTLVAATAVSLTSQVISFAAPAATTPRLLLAAAAQTAILEADTASIVSGAATITVSEDDGSGVITLSADQIVLEADALSFYAGDGATLPAATLSRTANNEALFKPAPGAGFLVEVDAGVATGSNPTFSLDSTAQVTVGTASVAVGYLADCSAGESCVYLAASSGDAYALIDPAGLTLASAAPNTSSIVLTPADGRAAITSDASVSLSAGGNSVEFDAEAGGSVLVSGGSLEVSGSSVTLAESTGAYQLAITSAGIAITASDPDDPDLPVHTVELASDDDSITFTGTDITFALDHDGSSSDFVVNGVLQFSSTQVRFPSANAGGYISFGDLHFTGFSDGLTRVFAGSDTALLDEVIADATASPSGRLALGSSHDLVLSGGVIRGDIASTTEAAPFVFLTTGAAGSDLTLQITNNCISQYDDGVVTPATIVAGFSIEGETLTSSTSGRFDVLAPLVAASYDDDGNVSESIYIYADRIEATAGDDFAPVVQTPVGVRVDFGFLSNLDAPVDTLSITRLDGGALFTAAAIGGVDPGIWFSDDVLLTTDFSFTGVDGSDAISLSASDAKLSISSSVVTLCGLTMRSASGDAYLGCVGDDCIVAVGDLQLEDSPFTLLAENIFPVPGSETVTVAADALVATTLHADTLQAKSDGNAMTTDVVSFGSPIELASGVRIEELVFDDHSVTAHYDDPTDPLNEPIKFSTAATISTGHYLQLPNGDQLRTLGAVGASSNATSWSAGFCNYTGDCFFIGSNALSDALVRLEPALTCSSAISLSWSASLVRTQTTASYDYTWTVSRQDLDGTWSQVRTATASTGTGGKHLRHYGDTISFTAADALAKDFDGNATNFSRLRFELSLASSNSAHVDGVYAGFAAASANLECGTSNYVMAVHNY
jgi:hypothetical protein